MHAANKSLNLTKVACNRAYNGSCMRRWMAIAAFGLLLTVPVWAQHGGGGHGGGGGHAGGFGGGHSGGFSGHSSFSGSGGHAGFSAPRSSSSSRSSSGFGVHSYSGPRSQAFSRGFVTAPSSRFSTRAGLSNRPFLHDGFRGNGFRNGNFGRFRNFGFRNNCIGFGCRFFGSPWGYAGYWDPWWWWNSDSNYDQDYNDNLAEAEQMNEQSLEEQQMLRQEDADGDQDAYNQRGPRRHNSVDQDPVEKDGTAFMPATVLIFRDQHRREVDNYAIVGQTVWVFAPRQSERIPLADLDVAATVKANEDRGVTFRLPVGNEGQ
jgi:hypothetical protein